MGGLLRTHYARPKHEIPDSPFIIRKRAEIFGPRTWALVRECYLAGETASSISSRLGPSEDAIRGRIHREGWSKQAHAETMDRARLGPLHAGPDSPAGSEGFGGEIPPRTPQFQAPESETSPDAALDPQTLLREAATAARRAIAGGRASEAAALVKAAEGLLALVRQIEAPAPPPPDHGPDNGEDDAADDPIHEPGPEAEGDRNPPGDSLDSLDLTPKQKAWCRKFKVQRERQNRTLAVVYDLAVELAGRVGCELLADEPHPPALFSRFIYGWRKENLPPEKSASDFRRAREDGWWRSVFNEDGSVKPTGTPAEHVERLSPLPRY